MRFTTIFRLLIGLTFRLQKMAFVGNCSDYVRSQRAFHIRILITKHLIRGRSMILDKNACMKPLFIRGPVFLYARRWVTFNSNLTSAYAIRSFYFRSCSAAKKSLCQLDYVYPHLTIISIKEPIPPQHPVSDREIQDSVSGSIRSENLRSRNDLYNPRRFLETLTIKQCMCKCLQWSYLF